MADEPITQKITADLRRQIQEGILGPGALLLSETEVAHEYGVSRQTARSALQALEHEGLVIVRPRRGRVVRSNQRLRWHLTEFERPGSLARFLLRDNASSRASTRRADAPHRAAARTRRNAP